MSRKVALVSLGCPKNLVNSEQMLHLLKDAGFDMVSSPEGADAVVINTCGFIDAAKTEAIDTILSCAELKKAKKLQKIVVAGCLAERYQDDILKELPEIDSVIGVGSFDEIVAAVSGALEGKGVRLFGDKNAPVYETERIVSTGPGWAYLRIAEGCSNHCAFCVIPSIRGRYRSRPLDRIAGEAEKLARSGIRELIVIAQDVTFYGLDLYKKPMLTELCKRLSAIDGIEWIRLHYLYPERIDDELIAEIAEEPKIVKYLDIPLQHINDDILRRMNRRSTGKEIRELIKKLREQIPDLVLRTSLITGLPGEGEAEFIELCDFLREARIERAGVFPYSPEEGTPAAEMPDRCDREEAERRAGIIEELQSGIMDDWNDSCAGKVMRVLCEGREDGLCIGRTYADSPEIDGLVRFTGDTPPGDFADVLITGTDGGALLGKTAADPAPAT